MERRLAEIPTAEWGDLSIDITPREYVLDYLTHSFPTQLFEVYSDEDGNLHSRPVFDADGNPVQSREAVERRERMIEHLASLPPVHGALDQIVQRFGTEQVAEVTGRSRRIVKQRSATATGSASRPGRPPPISPRRPPSRMTTSASWCSAMPAAPAAATTPISLARISAGACTTCSSRAGRPTPPSRVWAARTAPIRSSRRCSGRSPPTSKARSAFCRRSRAGSTRSARSPGASARPAARACSGPTTIWKAPMPALRCDSSMPCSSPARSRAARCSSSRRRPGSS